MIFQVRYGFIVIWIQISEHAAVFFYIEIYSTYIINTNFLLASLLNDFVPLLTPVDGNTWQWTGFYYHFVLQVCIYIVDQDYWIGSGCSVCNIHCDPCFKDFVEYRG